VGCCARYDIIGSSCYALGDKHVDFCPTTLYGLKTKMNEILVVNV